MEVTEDIVHIVLQKRYQNNYELLTWSLENLFDELNGLMGTHHVLKVTIKRENNISTDRFFVKPMRTNNPIMEQSNKIVDVFEKELFVYNLFDKIREDLPNIETNMMPQFYFGRNGTIILEDIIEKGFKMPNPPIIDHEHVFNVLGEVAKFHAISLAYEDLKSKKLGRLWRLSEDYSEFMKEGIMRTEPEFFGNIVGQRSIEQVQYYIDMIPEKRLPRDEFKKKISDLGPTVTTLLNNPNKFRNVLCHGDLWGKNLAFRYENGKPVECKIFDFQLNRYQPPAFDILFHIYFTTRNKVRKACFARFLSHYYSSLRVELGKFGLKVEEILPFYELEYTCKIYSQPCQFFRLLAGAVVHISSEWQKVFSKSDEDFHRFMYVDRFPACKEVFEKDEMYRDLILDALDMAHDMFVYEMLLPEDIWLINKKDYLINDVNFKMRQDDSDKILYDMIIDFQGETSEEYQVVKYKSYDIQKDFAKEYEFYRKILEDLRKHGIELESVQKNYLYRLGDVAVFEKVKSLNNTKILLENINSIIRSLADFHAGFYVYETNKSNGTLYRLTDDYPLIMGNDRLTIHPKLKQLPPTLVHGNIKCSNICAQNINGKIKVKLLNFTTYWYAPPSTDVMQLLNLIGVDADDHEGVDKLINIYIDELDNILRSRGCNIQHLIVHQN